jgi:hypothetical protein
MNQRITELMLEAGKTIPGDKHIDADFCEKFAELIVKECIEQSMSIGRYNTPSGITPDLSIAIAVGLKKHFGVEE